MSPSNDEFSDTDSDDGFDEDMEVLKKAWQLTGKKPIDHQLSIAGATANSANSLGTESDEEGDGDLELVQSIQERFAIVPMDTEVEPLRTLPPDWSDGDDCEDDYATLRAIQRRFAAYNDGGLEDIESNLNRPAKVGSIIIDSEKETSNSFVQRTNTRERFVNRVDTSGATEKETEACDDAGGTQSSHLVDRNGPDSEDVAGLLLKSTQFPESAVSFVDAIKKNRSCQKLIRCKMMQVEARLEELDNLMERLKILKDFQTACKKRTGHALSQKIDARVRLISLPKLHPNMKLNENNVPAVYKAPPENAHVAYYKEALATFAVNVTRGKWSNKEQENILKGVKQQFQEMLLQRSVDLISGADESHDPGNVDSILKSIKDIDITPDKIRLFSPKVNWERLATMYVPGRSAAECQARFLNFVDPLISHNIWTAMEDKNLLNIVQKQGLSNWIDIAASLGTNRTPFQCLERYQRSLNASILKREWSKDDDNQLRTAVETYGESNWQVVASVLEGRAGTQCSNRWLKTLHPSRKNVGRWTAEEDKRLKVAVTLFGPKTWRVIAKYVPGRTHVQCRERWVNSLNPSLNMAKWTKEEDSMLERASKEHGYCWSRVAACIPNRTDNQCWRRWKVLFPNEVPMLQAAKKIRQVALISNFVDRESERPAIGPSDFRLPDTLLITGSENADSSRKKRGRRSSKVCSEGLNNGNADEDLQPPRKRKSKRSPPCPDTVLQDMSNGAEIKRRKKRSSLKSKAGIVMEPHLNEDECLLPTQIKKASKLRPRRRRNQSGEVAVLEKVNEENTVATDESESHFPDSMTLSEAFQGIKAKRRKRKVQENCPSVDCMNLVGGAIHEDRIVGDNGEV